MKYTQQLLRLIVENQKADIEEILEYLAEIGIINDLNTQRSLIKIEYMKRLIDKETKSGNKLKIDLAVKYDCSVDHVNNCIYKHSEIRV